MVGSVDRKTSRTVQSSNRVHNFLRNLDSWDGEKCRLSLQEDADGIKFENDDDDEDIG